jgi:phosphoheptose isomerase
MGGGSLFVAGNGGSAAIADHLVCDYAKGIEEKSKYKPRVFSLSSNQSLITAIANDVDFSKIFVNQIVGRVSQEDLFVLISSSGTSKNIVSLCEYLNKTKITYISIFGFNSELQVNNNATVKIHINSSDYGVIEDASQIIMHTMQKIIIKRLHFENI